MLFLQARVLYNFAVPNNADELYYNQTLDHFNTDADSYLKNRFPQRYYTVFDFIPKDGFETAILYLGGEAELRESSLTNKAYSDLANRTKSALFGIEHRFFGKSYPFKLLSTENLRYHTAEQSLADYDEFINKVIKVHEKVKKGSNVRVMVVGGSYTGAMSSWFRLKYPQDAVASWASSAPVHPVNEFPEYDQHIADVLNGYEKCLPNTKSVLDSVHNAVVDHDEQFISKVRQDFNFTEEEDEISILYCLVDALSGMIQYENIFHTLSAFCEHQKEKPSYKSFVQDINDFLDISGSTIQESDLLLLTPQESTSELADSRSWNWMVCNQFGWFQTASGALRSSYVNMTYFTRVCDLLYGIQPSNTEIVSAEYGDIDPSSTHVYYSYGDVDPWTKLGVTEGRPELQRKFVMIEGGSHCSDMSRASEGDSDALADAREDIMQTMEDWLVHSESTCKVTCVYGKCVDGKCLCDNGYGGSKCDTVYTAKSNLDAAIITAISVPTLAAVAAIYAFWWFGYRPKHMPKGQLNGTPLLAK